jgi:ribose transport system permease protein
MEDFHTSTFPHSNTNVSRLFSDYGIVLALFLICGYFTLATYSEQHPRGAAAGRQLAARINQMFPGEPGVNALVVAGGTREEAEFTRPLMEELPNDGVRVVEVVRGQPSDARKALDRLASSGTAVAVIACSQTAAGWSVFDDLSARYPGLASARIMKPSPYMGSNFLKTENLLNIANQIAVIAIIAIGMTLVIITGGIDLSVGSLIALAAVAASLLIREYGGAESASVLAMTGGSLAAILLCGGIGLLSGLMVAVLRIPAFIATLGMMLVASGLAFILAKGQSIYQVPDSYVWLGRGAELGIPNAVLLMLGLYGIAHLYLARAASGRHVYAVGANQEAARLSGVPVKRTLVFVYTLCGLLAGLGGIVMASQLKSGAPTYGQMYELYVIAAVVVGGTSLSGGQGKAFGTLIGALIIAVIQNGMNLTGVESYTQKVVLGLVILGAVILDQLKRRGFGRH